MPTRHVLDSTMFQPGPGSMMTGGLVDWCVATIAGLEVERRGAPAGHHTPEDRPEEVAAAISGWLDRHGLRAPRES